MSNTEVPCFILPPNSGDGNFFFFCKRMNTNVFGIASYMVFNFALVE